MSFKPSSLLIIVILLLAFAKATYAQSPISESRLENLVTQKVSMDKDGDFKDRYKIQLYYGSLDGANSMLNKYRGRYSEWSSSLEYEAPNHKVWVGNFRNRLEADRALIRIKRDFPSAFIFSM